MATVSLALLTERGLPLQIFGWSNQEHSRLCECASCCARKCDSPFEERVAPSPSRVNHVDGKLETIAQRVSLILIALLSKDSDKASAALESLFTMIRSPFWPSLAGRYYAKLMTAKLVTHDQITAKNLQTYIIYLEPSKKSHLKQQVFVAKEYLASIIGRDESYRYPSVHCSLTGFFAIESRDSSHSRLEAEQRVIRDALKSSINELLNFEGNRSNGRSDLLSLWVNDSMVNHGKHDETTRRINEGLKWVKVSPEKDLFIPLDNGAWQAQAKSGKKRLNHMCSLLEERLDHHNLTAVSRRSGKPGIQTKRGDHVSILSSKNRTHNLSRKQVHKIALFFDQMFWELKDMTWDIVVYQVVAWGQQNNPHLMNEVVRVSNNATTTG